MLPHIFLLQSSTSMLCGFAGCLQVKQMNSQQFLLLAGAFVCLSCVRGTSSCRLETPVGRAEAESPSTGQCPPPPPQRPLAAATLTCLCCVLLSKLYGDQARFFEQEKVPRIKHRRRGTVSMVNNGSGQHGSQVSPSLLQTHTLTL